MSSSKICRDCKQVTATYSDYTDEGPLCMECFEKEYRLKASGYSWVETALGSIVHVVIKAPTKWECETGVEEYKKQYIPAGYGTRVDDIRELPTGYWRATLTRGDSCD